MKPARDVVQMAVAPMQRAVTENLNPRPRGRRLQKTRARIQKRDNSTCQGCGLLWVPWLDQVDHTVPRARGGADTDENQQLLCRQCHSDKTAAENSGRVWTPKRSAT